MRLTQMLVFLRCGTYRKITNEDPVSQLLKWYIADGWSSTADEWQESVRKYFSFRDELCIVDRLILKSLRIVIPESHRPVSLAKLHTSHLGKTKTTLWACMCVFLPGISKDIANMIEKCEVCQKYQDKQPWEEITSPPIPSSPWHTIASDLFQFRGKTHLIISDRYRKFIIVCELPDHSAEHTIRAFRGIFCEHDIPHVLITDHGSNYMSSTFTVLCWELDISHIWLLPIITKATQLNELYKQSSKLCKSVLKLATHGTWVCLNTFVLRSQTKYHLQVSY